jgi:hypothetical protein
VRGQLSGKIEQVFDDLLGVAGRIPANVRGDAIDISSASSDQISA